MRRRGVRLWLMCGVCWPPAGCSTWGTSRDLRWPAASSSGIHPEFPFGFVRQTSGNARRRAVERRAAGLARAHGRTLASMEIRITYDGPSRPSRRPGRAVRRQEGTGRGTSSRRLAGSRAARPPCRVFPGSRPRGRKPRRSRTGGHVVRATAVRAGTPGRRALSAGRRPAGHRPARRGERLFHKTLFLGPEASRGPDAPDAAGLTPRRRAGRRQLSPPLDGRQRGGSLVPPPNTDLPAMTNSACPCPAAVGRLLEPNRRQG